MNSIEIWFSVFYILLNKFRGGGGRGRREVGIVHCVMEDVFLLLITIKYVLV